jgi:outer membrane protein TolC
VRRRNLADAVIANRRAVEMATELFTKGLANFLNVLDAERSLYRSEDDLVQSERTVSLNLVMLYKALGGGWENEPS